ncbi:MAG: hypothetical protein IT385_09800 [Deltaproteobacteria bacterium]|nr:hypothetical protein [Deltaproteobacteria bacterium]
MEPLGLSFLLFIMSPIVWWIGRAMAYADEPRAPKPRPRPPAEVIDLAAYRAARERRLK